MSTLSAKSAAMRSLLLLSLTAIGLLEAASTTRRRSTNLPAWVDCTSNLDCAPGYCCTISFEKFSYPRCQRMHTEGEFCRPGGPLTTNGSRYYPDELEIKLDEVFMMFCPCTPELTCDKDDGVCKDASETKDFNYLYNRSSKKDD